MNTIEMVEKAVQENLRRLEKDLEEARAEGCSVEEEVARWMEIQAGADVMNALVAPQARPRMNCERCEAKGRVRAGTIHMCEGGDPYRTQDCSDPACTEWICDNCAEPTDEELEAAYGSPGPQQRWEEAHADRETLRTQLRPQGLQVDGRKDTAQPMPALPYIPPDEE